MSKTINLDTEVLQIITWLEQNFQPADSTASVRKLSVFEDYVHMCQVNGLKHKAQSVFGKIVRHVFPEVLSSRSGGKGKSSQTYKGLYRRFSTCNPRIVTDVDLAKRECDLPTMAERLKQRRMEQKRAAQEQREKAKTNPPLKFKYYFPEQSSSATSSCSSSRAASPHASSSSSTSSSDELTPQASPSHSASTPPTECHQPKVRQPSPSLSPPIPTDASRIPSVEMRSPQHSPEQQSQIGRRSPTLPEQQAQISTVQVPQYMQPRQRQVIPTTFEGDRYVRSELESSVCEPSSYDQRRSQFSAYTTADNYERERNDVHYPASSSSLSSSSGNNQSQPHFDRTFESYHHPNHPQPLPVPLPHLLQRHNQYYSQLHQQNQHQPQPQQPVPFHLNPYHRRSPCPGRQYQPGTAYLPDTNNEPAFPHHQHHRFRHC